MSNKYLEKIAGFGAAKAAFGKFTRAVKGTDASDLKASLKSTPVNRDNLAARVDLSKRYKAARNQTYAARGAVGAAGAIAVGGAAAATKKD